MTALELALPWRTFDVHLRRWRLVVEHDGRTAPLSADELLSACAALELGRDPQRAVRDAVLHRSGGRRGSLTWRDLVGRAPGLSSRAGAEGSATLTDCLAALRLTFVRCEYARPPATQAAA